LSHWSHQEDESLILLQRRSTKGRHWFLWHLCSYSVMEHSKYAIDSLHYLELFYCTSWL